MSDLPEPFVPADVDLRDFPFTPMYRARLFGSAFHAKANDAEWRAGVTLWLKAQDQVPAGSLPGDDVELCRLAEFGRDIKTWRKVRAGALHGWTECADGRLYNKVVAQVVLDQWQGKIEQRNRTRKARIAALEKRLSQATDDAVKADVTEQLQRLRQEALSQEPVTASKRERQGERERKGQGEGIKERLSSAPRPDVIEKFWASYPPRKGSKATAEANKKIHKLLASGVSAEEILTGAAAYRRDCDANDRTGTEYVAMASTWLNQRRWEDYKQTPARNGSAPKDRRLQLALGDDMTQRFTDRGLLALNEQTKWLEWTDKGLASQEYHRLTEGLR